MNFLFRKNNLFEQRLEEISQFKVNGLNNTLIDCEKKNIINENIKKIGNENGNENGNGNGTNINKNSKSTICLYNYEVEFPKVIDTVISTKGYNRKNLIKINMMMHPLNNSITNNITNNNKIHIHNIITPNNRYNISSIKDKVFFSKDVIKNKKNVNLKSPITYYLIEQLTIDKNYKVIIQQLYNDIYLTYSIKHSFTKNIKNYKMPDLISIVNDLIIENIQILKNYLKKYTSLVNKLATIDLAKNNNINRCNIFNIESNHKVIIIGDTHGSFHTFFRIFLRLRKQNIINEKLELTNGTKLIILGDVLDRGKFALEILFLLFLLMKINNSINELNVIFNRGNHEHLEQYYYYGFLNELEIKNKKNKKNSLSNTFITNLNSFFCWTCTAIILKHKNTKYWLCHGGIPNLDIFKALDNIKQENNNHLNALCPSNLININALNVLGEFENHKVIILGQKFQTQISWNDFTTKYNIQNTTRRSNLYKIPEIERDMFKIGLKNIFDFLHIYKFDFIIRAHQDHNCNSWLLSSLFSDSGSEILPLDFKLAKTALDGFKESNSNLTTYKNAFQYQIQEGRTKADGPFLKIDPKSSLFKIADYNSLASNTNQSLLQQKIESKKVYPVLTISTNSSIGRNLYNDTYVILD